MILRASKPYEDFIDYLNEQNFTSLPCVITFIPGFTVVSASEDENEVGFAVYNVQDKSIFVAGDTAEIAEDMKKATGFNPTPQELEDHVLQNIAHEYKHHLQNVNNVSFDEDEAEEFALSMVTRYRSHKIIVSIAKGDPQ